MAQASPDNAARPLVTLLLITYNQQRFVADAVRSVLQQTYSPLEIIISDDASGDDTFSIAQACVAEYSGPHKVILNRNGTNQGISAHLSQLAERSHGELLFVAAGDDIALPNRCEAVVNAWLAHGRRPDLIATDLYDLDEAGNVHDRIEVTDLATYRTIDDWAQRRPHVVGASHAWTRRLFETFGGMEPGMYGEDQIMTFRAIVSGGAITVREPLIQYWRGGLSRKRKWRTADEFVARFRLATRNGLAETRQLVHDADIAGVGERMRAILASKSARENYAHTVFNARSIGERIRALRKARDVSPGYRIRVLLYATCPWIYQPVFFVKWHLRR